jgi:glycosyltransferase involved in cell wall biosynthesis
MESQNKKFSVIVSNASKHHSFETALAAQKAGILKRFIVSTYYSPEKFPYFLAAPFNNLIRGLKNRCHPELNPGLVTSFPISEILSRAMTKLAFIDKSKIQTMAFLMQFVFFDYSISKFLIDKCDIFHGFLGCSLHSFKIASRYGALTVLDQPTPHIAFWKKIIAEEEDRTGFTIQIKKMLSDVYDERQRKELELADYIFVPSQFCRETLLSYGIPSNKIRVLPFGSDITRFQPSENKKKSEKFKILCVARIEALKGVHYLLEAFRQLKLKNAELILIGKPSADGIAILKKYAGLYHHIDYVPNYEIQQWYNSADIYVLPSLLEGSSYTIYEAMACGLPSIITENCGSVVRNGIDGYVIPIRDIDALKEKITLLYENPQLRKEMGMNAHQHIQNFTWAHYHENLIRTYHEILDIKRKSVTN